MGFLAWLFGDEGGTVETMNEAVPDPAIVYASQKTGWFVTEDNRFLLSDEDLAEWDAAIEEHDSQHRQPGRWLIGTIAFYGLDGKVPTKITAGVIRDDNTKLITQHWIGTKVTDNPKVKDELQAFFRRYGVKSILVGSGNVGCTHEEGLDFPVGEDCPFCPSWKGKQGSIGQRDESRNDEPTGSSRDRQ